MTVKEQLFAKLAEVEELLLEASCDDIQLAEDDEAFTEVRSYLTRLEEAIEYYVD
jgi:hypothetical protein